MSHELLKNETGLIVRAEIDMQITTAKAYPRDVSKFVEKATYLATLDEETAESCIYCKSRKNKKTGEVTEIKGASIRLAEISAGCWGNLHAAARITNNDGKNITSEGVAWDLETNTRMVAEVKRSILTSDGKPYGEEMQTVTGNAACAIARRNSIFQIVPKALVNIVYLSVVKFILGDQKTINAKRKNIFDRFTKLGIEQEKIFSYFNKTKIDEFNVKDLESLIGIGTAIKQNEIKIENAFELTDENIGMTANDRVQHLLENKGNQQPT